MNPLNWPAGPFLLLYILCAGVMLLGLGLWRNHLGRSQPRAGAEPLDAIQFAYLAGGPARAADTVLVGLLETGAVQHAARSGYITAGAAGWPRGLDAYEVPLYGRVNRRKVQNKFRGHAACIRGELVSRGLICDPATVLEYRMGALLALSSVVLLGVSKIIIGTERGHPVGFLVALVGITLFLGGLVALRGPYISRAGRQALAQIRSNSARALRAPVGEELLLAFALTGGAVLAGRAYHPLFVSSGFDGGSGCSGGGCGGGGGGGGCGGCS